MTYKDDVLAAAMLLSGDDWFSIYFRYLSLPRKPTSSSRTRGPNFLCVLRAVADSAGVFTMRANWIPAFADTVFFKLLQAQVADRI
jgi:hypothetical protein